MSFILSENTTRRELLEPDNYAARCYGLVIVGTKFNQQFGKASTQVVIMWELPTETFTSDKDGEQKTLPKVFSKTYTWSFNEKSNLRKTLEAWRGKKFSAEELKGFDLRKVVGTPCLLNIIKEDKDTGSYNTIASVSKLPNLMTCPPQMNENLLFDITDPAENLDKMELMPQWIQDRIRESDEYQKRMWGDDEDIPDDYEF